MCKVPVRRVALEEQAEVGLAFLPEREGEEGLRSPEKRTIEYIVV